jgi:hypothetical protein
MPMGHVIYEIRIRGALGARTTAAFAEMEVSTETVLRGPLDDQATLHRLLDRIRDLGLDLVAVRQVASSPR